jgi:leader peptidase (prepilin peptidase)/N-methyltransferase
MGHNCTGMRDPSHPTPARGDVSVVAGRVDYGAGVDASAATIAAAAAVGVLAGAVLDPLAQQLADDSRARDTAPPVEVAPSAPEAIGRPVDRVPTALLPTGHSPARTAAAAVVTGALAAAAAVRLGARVDLVAYGVLFAVLVAVSVTDLSHRLVPRRLVYPGAAVVAAALVADALVRHQPGRLGGAVIGGGVAFGVFFVVWWFVPRGMGFGDVRLAGLIGLALGYLGLLVTYLGFLSAFVLGALGGVAVMAATGSGRRTRVPFAPALAAGAVVAVLAGPHVASNLFGAGG